MIDKDVLKLLVKWRYVPQLSYPVMIAGFFGWSNAGSVSSDTIEYLYASLRPRRFATMSDEVFANYTLERPNARIEDGVIKEMDVLNTDFSCKSNPNAMNDVVLFLGREPNYSWQAYCELLIGVMKRLKIRRLYTIGGVQDTISHTSEPIMSLVATTPPLVEEILSIDREAVIPATYSGPVSIHSYLLRACADAGLQAAGLWGHAPAYLQKNPRVVAKMVGVLAGLTGFDISLGALNQKALEVDRKINDAVARDPNLRKLVEAVEREEEGDAPCAADDDKVIRLEDFLRRDAHKNHDTD
jgi:proteasome assembly chaperone (PAC2) family protein